MKWGFLREDNGNFSSIRLIAVLWGVGMFVVWAAISIIKRAPQDIPVGILGFASSVILWKAAQKYGEKGPPSEGGQT